MFKININLSISRYKCASILIENARRNYYYYRQSYKDTRISKHSNSASVFRDRGFVKHYDTCIYIPCINITLFAH